MKRFLLAAICVLTLMGAQGAAAQPVSSQSFHVDARVHGWQATGIVVKKNHSVVVTATGSGCAIANQVCFDPSGAGYDLPTYEPYANAPWVGGPAYALVGQVGGQPVFIGDGSTMVTGSGELFLAFNDDRVDDNSGGYDVTITICRPGNGHGDQNHCHPGPPGQS